MSLAAELSEFVLQAEPDAQSAEAERIMRLSLYDWMVCGLAGAGEPVARMLRQVACPGGGSAVFAGGEAFYPAPSAAWINGAASHALDYDDTHFAHIGHPSVAVLSAAFAMPGSDGQTLWAALVGAEVSVRIGLWLGRSHYQTGFHQTATAGAFGAAAAAGRLGGLTSGQMQAAFGLAATQAAGLKSQFGTMGKPYHAGLAARTGVEAALLALAGFDTRGQGLDGPQGFGPTHAGEANADAFDRLGTQWYMETVSHKFHACCHGLHAMLEALAGVEVPPAEVAEVRVTTHPRWLSVCNIAEPQTGLECKFSYRQTAAMALSGISTAALDSYTEAMARDPGLEALRRKVDVQADETLTETEARVRVIRTDGREIEAGHDLSAPLSHAVRVERLRAKGRALVGEEMDATLWDAVQGAPDVARLRKVMRAGLPGG